VKASKTFCVLVANTDPQKVLGASKEPKAMRLLCSQWLKSSMARFADFTPRQ
jgi:hypothetical protein